eukprot:CAMPEP_0170515666 /NCGR_PEP_ID=MMETSP0209-20121228/2077_1 /TAXON_ID=665100 ORGANISM="Litonotus pictus, Strain P1" /NCGR_SAMPLE_ID=MMETSP0209 /ASSEMBLY_ACC=CAM_ASM_000301 /LENGTH=240 /DNA_ID=CAMNT_0010800259 /DNA_START=1 /DNA_END=724 /DNA_ORIENTATION=+
MKALSNKRLYPLRFSLINSWKTPQALSTAPLVGFARIATYNFTDVKKGTNMIGREMNYWDRKHRDDEGEIDWEAQDNWDMKKRKWLFTQSDRYLRLMTKWQKTLEYKKHRKLNNKKNLEIFPKSEADNELLVVHQPKEKILLNPSDDKIFAVIEYNGFQHKVTKDDLVMMEKLPFNAGDSFVIDKVLLIGTTEFTSVGRPVVANARVLCTVEEKPLTEKVIVFKKEEERGIKEIRVIGKK